MKKLFQTLMIAFSVIFIACTLGLVMSCSKEKGNKPAPKKELAEIILNKTEINAIIGDKTALKVRNDYLFDSITWTSEDQSVAIVSDRGVVEAFGVGSTKIKASSGNKVAECTISVGLGNSLPQIIIENEQSEYTISKATESFPFNAYVLFNGKKFYDLTVEYKSSNDGVIDVSGGDGALKVKDVGSSVISLNATWRNLSFEDVPSLFKVVNVTVVEEVYFYLNGRQYSELTLYTLNNFKGVDYVSEMDFVPTVEVNGKISSEVEIQLPDIVKSSDGKLYSNQYGEGKIILTHNAADGKVYSFAIDVDVVRPYSKHDRTINYFSSFTGTFKDEESGFEDKNLINELFQTESVENLKVFQEKKELEVQDGKVLNANLNTSGAYSDTFRFETDKFIYDVDVTVYALVIQKAEDLKNLEIKIVKSDDVEEKGDQTEITFIDGYCELLNNIDATGIKLEHTALTTEYEIVNLAGRTVSVKVEPSRYNQVNGIGKFGFGGVFNGNGYTISNLDTSVEEGEMGTGLFGYILGGAQIINLALDNAKISNSSGFAYGAHVPIPVGEPDGLGLRRQYTQFKDVYIKLSPETVNPQGAIMKSVYNTWNGVYDFTNVIIDARGVSTNGSTAGGILTADGTMLYKAAYCTRKDVFVITDEYPLSFNNTFTVYGENEAGDNELNQLIDGKAYSKGVKRYDTITDLIEAKNSYAEFGNVWSISSYPVFKTAFEVLPVYNGEEIYDGIIVANSNVESKLLEIKELATGNKITATFTDYDTEKLLIDADGNLKLINNVTEEERLSLTVNYQYKGKSQSIELTVRVVPSSIVIDEQIIFSAIDGNFDVSKYFENSENIISAWQVSNDGDKELTVNNGKIKGVVVQIKDDYSDVNVITIKVKTNVTEYVFTKVKAYTKIIKTANDLKLFERSLSAGRTTGYYILDKNIDAAGLTLSHKDIKLGDTSNVFQGVFDGNGYSIMNFKPDISGLFGSIYSSSEAGGMSIIKDVAFIGVKSEEKKNFTILAQYLDSSAEGVTTEITNVHVSIPETHNSFGHTSNYMGLFNSNSAEKDAGGVFNNFKLTNVYVEILSEAFNGIMECSVGTIFTRDHMIYSSTDYSRGIRFDNVVTVSKAPPMAYRQWVGDYYATEWGVHMYFAYAENDTVGLGYKEEFSSIQAIYPHQTVENNPDIGCFVYKNVYRYDSVIEAATAKKQAFLDSGLWELSSGALKWKSAPFETDPTDESNNFSPDWLEELN